MASDDFFYAVTILSSVAAGLLFRKVTGEENRRWLSTLLGVVLLYVLCGSDCWHFVITVVGNCIIICFPQKCHLYSFVWNFGYLAVFRTVHLVGLPAPSPIANAAQLFLTLRMIGLAFDVYDSRVLVSTKKGESGDALDQNQLLIKYTAIAPNAKDIFCFAFCYIGSLTGPYYKYHIYRDWLRQPNPEKIPLQEPLIAKARPLPAIVVTYLVCSYFFSIKYVETDEFYENPFWFRLFYMVPMFMVFRTRLYTAWLLSECMCITAGFAAYPTQANSKCGSGPTDFAALDKAEKEGAEKYDYETVHNLDIYGCELAPLTKQGLRSWNMTVQYWLATYIHRRVPPPLKPYRVSVTMGVSAFWHGIHPGYYLSFLTVPPILMAEEAMAAAFRKDATPGGQQLFDWGCWFFKMRGFDYMCMGFLLLKLGATLRYWHSIYFAGHLVMVFFLVLGNVGKVLMRSRGKREGGADDGGKQRRD
ncbi:membrane-bound acylglycerophosphatidylinositol O-acyltransferase mboat7-like isoform X2 [Babylonia areolata]|uniref:membrane-bound acylglycerophosphatidylinositol O-acyltransferase mboat7-like isoform X2 n=1 Tax=Babylonia areolata TaxID=304850 RepID=UPI003FD00762